MRAELTKSRKMNRIEDIMLELNKAEFDYLRGTREFENILNELKARKETSGNEIVRERERKKKTGR